MTSVLRIFNSPSKLTLPLDFVTDTQAILAKKGKGKSHTGSVQAEELLDAKQQVVIFDPTDAWYGLRSSRDGKSPAYAIPVFGGDHADVPLDPRGGVELAEAIATEHFSAIVCTDNMTKGEELRFAIDFFDTLYRKNRTALHLFVDEADIFAPQRPFGDEMKTLGTMDNIVRRGRKKGIGCTLISQRAAVLNKNVLSQIDMLVAMGMTYHGDIDQVEKWVERHDTRGAGAAMIESLPSLPRGDAWVWHPGRDILERVTVRDRHTFASGATPKPGEKKRVAKVLAPIDIERLGARIAASVEQAKANDPKVLKAKVADLEKRLAAQSDTTTRAVAAGARLETKLSEKKTVEKRVEVPVLKDKHLARAEALINRTEKVLLRATKMESTISSSLNGAARALIDLRDAVKQSQQIPLPLTIAVRQNDSAKADFFNPAATNGHAMPRIVIKRSGYDPAKGRAVRDPTLEVGELKLEKAHLKILEALAWMEKVTGQRESDGTAVAFLAGYSSTSGHFTNTRGALRTAGLVDYPCSGTLTLTDAGRAIAPTTDIPLTRAMLHRAVLDKLESAQARILDVLIRLYPEQITSSELAEAAGMRGSSGHFTNTRGRLRTIGLVTYPSSGMVRAADLLFPEHLP